jgi:polar amino acid transport system permease protein
MLDIIIRYHQAFLKGLLTTAELVTIVWVCGLFCGIILGILADRFKAFFHSTKVISFLLSGIPILVILYWVHYPLQVLLKAVIDPFITATVVLSLVNTFYVCDTVRNTLESFPAQFTTAAKVSGLNNWTIAWRIQIPIVFRQLIPSLLTTEVMILQTTLFASLISVNEIFRVCQLVNAKEYKPVEIYTALAIFFLIICLPLNGLAVWFKNKYTRDISDN